MCNQCNGIELYLAEHFCSRSTWLCKVRQGSPPQVNFEDPVLRGHLPIGETVRSFPVDSATGRGRVPALELGFWKGTGTVPKDLYGQP